MSLDNLTGSLDSATNLTGAVNNAVTDLGQATGLSGALDSVTGIFKSLGNFFKTLSGTQLPLPNVLNAYASYDYILSLACLSNAELTNPDDTYISGAPLTLICKSANADPNNRITTAYGKFDFFFQNLTFESTTQVDSDLTSSYKLDFTILEPYSMGLFFESLQAAADLLGYDNWRAAPFLIAIEFRGNTETGSMVPVPNTKRYIPFYFQDIAMDINEQGVIYRCKGVPTNLLALADKFAMLPTDVSMTGDTVASVLQSGEFSLQSVLNAFEKQKVAKGYQTTPHQYLIYFPQDPSSGSTGGSPGDIENTVSAIIDPAITGQSASSIQSKFNLVNSEFDQSLIQSYADLNDIGIAELGFSEDRPGDTPAVKDDLVYDQNSHTFFGGKLQSAVTASDFKFDQKTNVMNAINQVILQSDYVKAKLDPSSLSAEGYRDWWTIKTMTFLLDSAVDPITNDTPKLFVYKVIPYKTHASRLKAAGAGMTQYNLLSQQAVKVYNYLYTGKNDSILNLDLRMNNAFMQVMPQDAGTDSADIKTSDQQGSAGTTGDQPTLLSLKGQGPSSASGATPSILGYVGSLFKSDNKGGGGVERSATRAARAFLDAIASPYDIYDINLEIMGDPYYIAQSGLGNYTSQSTQFVNLNTDGSINYESGEVDIVINFRTPLDINQTTGLYNFGTNTQSAPALRFSGLYCVTNIRNSFENGQFRQQIKAFRRPDQESDIQATAEELANAAALVDPTDPQNSDITEQNTSDTSE